MTLGTQIGTGFAVLAVPVAILALVAFAVLSRLGGAVEAVLLENDRTLAPAETMDVALERLGRAAVRGVADEDVGVGDDDGVRDLYFFNLLLARLDERTWRLTA